MQLHAAAARGDLQGIRYALEHGALVDARNGQGMTALSFALETARAFNRRQGPKVKLKAVSLLLDAGASLDATDSLDRTPVDHAVAIANPDFINLMISKNGNLLRKSASGYSTMLQACYQPASNAKIQIMEKLAAAGVSLNQASQYGEFPLGVCLYFGDFACLNRLCQLGADQSPLQWTDLHCALAQG
jgi:ankyrin repeat protein